MAAGGRQRRKNPKGSTRMAHWRRKAVAVESFSQKGFGSRYLWLAGALLMLALLLAQAGAVHAQGAVRSVHGDWQIRCDTPPGAQAEQCALIQSVVAEDRSNAGLTVIVLKTADQKSQIGRASCRERV